MKCVGECRITYFNLYCVKNIYKSNLERSTIPKKNIFWNSNSFFLFKILHKKLKIDNNKKWENPQVKKAFSFTKKLFKLYNFCIFWQKKSSKLEISACHNVMPLSTKPKKNSKTLIKTQIISIYILQ